MHDVACEFARAAVRSKDAQKQLARTSLINTNLSKLTKWEMYGRQKNSYGSLVSGRINTKITIYKCIPTEFEDICASGFRSREFQLNVLSK